MSEQKQVVLMARFVIITVFWLLFVVGAWLVWGPKASGLVLIVTAVFGLVREAVRRG